MRHLIRRKCNLFNVYSYSYDFLIRICSISSESKKIIPLIRSKWQVVDEIKDNGATFH